MTRFKTLIICLSTAALAIGSPTFLITKTDKSEAKVSELELRVEDNGTGEYSIAGIPLAEISNIRRAPLALAVPEVTMEEVTATSITLGWTPVDGATGYEMAVRCGDEEIETVTAGPDADGFKIVNLEPDTEYQVTVTALASDPDYNSPGAQMTATTELWFSGGDGTTEHPWEIVKGSQLLLMSRLVNEEQAEEGTSNPYATASYVVLGDIDMSGIVDFTPIGAAKGNEIIQTPEKNVFSGDFDGGGHTVSGLTIEAEGSGTVIAALFGALNGATIHDLNLKGEFSSNGDVAVAGGFAGVMSGATSKIINCTFSGSVRAISADNTATAAGLVGLFMAGEVKDCAVTIDSGQAISATGVSPDAGGVAGYGNAGTVTGTTVTIAGKVEAVSERTERIATGQSAGAGGMIGTAFGTYISGGEVSVSGQILSRATCDAEPETATTTASAGGFCGHYAADVFQKVKGVISGSVIAEASDLAYAGGLVGQQARSGYSGAILDLTLQEGGEIKAIAINPPTGNTGSYAGGMYGMVSFQTASGAVSGARALIDGCIEARSGNQAMATTGGIAGSSASVAYSMVTIGTSGVVSAQNSANACAGGVAGILAAGNVTGCSAFNNGKIESPVNAGGLIGVASGTRLSKKNIRGCYTLLNGTITGGENGVTPKIGGIVGLNNSYAPVSACFWYAAPDSNVEGLSGATGPNDTGRLADTSKQSLEAAAVEMNDYLDSYQWAWDGSAGHLILSPVEEE